MSLASKSNAQYVQPSKLLKKQLDLHELNKKEKTLFDNQKTTSPFKNLEDRGESRAAMPGEKGTQQKASASPAREGSTRSFEGFRRAYKKLLRVHPELTEDKEKPTAVCAKKAHKGGFDAVIRVNSRWTLTKEAECILS